MLGICCEKLAPLLAAPSPLAELEVEIFAAADCCLDDYGDFHRCFEIHVTVPRDWDLFGGVISGVRGSVLVRALVRIERTFSRIGEYFGDEQDICRWLRT